VALAKLVAAPEPVALSPVAPATQLELEPASGTEHAPAPTPLGAVSPFAESQATHYCESCGSQLALGDVFCSECGTCNEPLGADPVAPSVSPVAVTHPVAKTQSAARAELSGEPKPEPKPRAEDFTEEPAIIAPEPHPFSVVAIEKEERDTRDIGDPLPWVAPAPKATINEDSEAAADIALDDEPAETDAKGRGMLVWALAGLLLLGVAGGASYAWREQLIALGGLDKGSGETMQADAGRPGVPRVAGTYTAFLMDQEIEISFEGDAAVLAESRGTARYFNTINGGRCVSRLVAIQSGGIGGEPSGKVLFSQQPKEGELPCGKDIPMLIDIDKQAMGDNGLVSRLAIEWQSPETKEVLMTGNLEAKK
jgi:hypothetical protein